MLCQAKQYSKHALVFEKNVICLSILRLQGESERILLSADLNMPHLRKPCRECSEMWFNSAWDYPIFTSVLKTICCDLLHKFLLLTCCNLYGRPLSYLGQVCSLWSFAGAHIAILAALKSVLGELSCKLSRETRRWNLMTQHEAIYSLATSVSQS